MAWRERLRLLTSLKCHALLILAKSYKPKSQLMHPQKLNIPQLTLAKLTQRQQHETDTAEVHNNFFVLFC